MISLVGLGIAYDITEAGLEELKGCDEAYCEVHTMPVPREYLGKLEEKCGKGIKVIGREEVEGRLLIEKALGRGGEGEGAKAEGKEGQGKRGEKGAGGPEGVQKKVCLLCGGDPLAATTHVSLLIDAKKAGVEARVVHNSSILSAACGKSGLQPYRFGKTVTVSFWRKNYEPTSPILLIGKNLEAGMHTLVLMDLDRELGMMDAKEGIGLLRKMEEAEGKGVLPERIVVLSRVGYPDEMVSYVEVGEAEGMGLGKPPFCIIIPAKLHEVEKEYLELFGKAGERGE
jgi:diphthine synthase